MSPRSIEHLAGVPSGRHAVFTRASDVRIKQVAWLWKPYLPLGKVVLVAGAPGHGKSQLTAMFAASATRGAFEPTDVLEPGKALIIAAEDDADDTIVPRLLAANADPRLVELLSMRQMMPDGLTVDGMIKLPGDVEVLHDKLKGGDIRLVVFDPVVSFFDREHSSHNNQDVRDVLGPLKALAGAYGTTIVAILHLNKSSEAKEWAGRISESHGFQAVARSILALGPDPDDDEGDEGAKKILAVPKANLTKRHGVSLRMEIRSAVVEQGEARVETSAIHVTGPCEIAADDLLMGREHRETYVVIRRFLNEFLEDRWHKTSELKAAAREEGLAWRTVERVRQDVCHSRKEMGVSNGVWEVALKSTPLARARAHAHAPAVLDVGGLRPDEDPTPSRPPSRGIVRGGGLPQTELPKAAKNGKTANTDEEWMWGE